MNINRLLGILTLAISLLFVSADASAWTLSGGNLMNYGMYGGAYYPYTGYYSPQYANYYQNPNKWFTNYLPYAYNFGGYGGGYGYGQGMYGNYGGYGSGQGMYGNYGGYGSGSYGSGYGGFGYGGYGGLFGGGGYGGYQGYGQGFMNYPYSYGYGAGSYPFSWMGYYPQTNYYPYYGYGNQPYGNIPSWYYGYYPSHYTPNLFGTI